ncbi:hypothetical protein C8R47DRAFT_1229545 [Mycena vitilis]|nr:hypothetical protein C8R47DRAFT_1229545 [Mycena vitilis]
MAALRARALSPEILWCIGASGDEETRRSLLQTSKELYRHLCPLRYTFVTVGTDAALVVRSLAQNPILPPLVESLKFLDPFARVDWSQWESILPQMLNLQILGISNRIPLPPDVVPWIRFNLLTFQSCSHLGSEWMDFLASQRSLESIRIVSNFSGSPPPPCRLPALHTVSGRSATLAKFARRYDLLNATFYVDDPLKPEHLRIFAASPSRLYCVRMSASQLLILLEGAPSILADLHYLMLDEQDCWLRSADRPEAGLVGALAQLGTKLHHLQCLQSLFLMCERDLDPDDVPLRRLLQRAEGTFFSKQLSSLYTASSIHTFHLHAVDGSLTVKKWGTVGEESCFTGRDRYIMELDIHYMHLY